MHNLQFVWVKIEDVPNTPVRHASRLGGLTCRSPGIAADRHQHVDTRTMFLGVRTEGGLSGGFLHVTEPTSRHCLIHRRIAFEDGASCRFISWRNLR